MAQKIPWTPAIKVGVEEIDEQHKELFERINTCFEALDAGVKRSDIAGAIGFMRAYVLKHFRDEEKLQRHLAYPQYDSHREEHRLFEDRLQALSKRLIKDGPTEEFVKDFEALAVNWLLQHIKVRDTDLAKYAKEVGVSRLKDIAVG